MHREKKIERRFDVFQTLNSRQCRPPRAASRTETSSLEILGKAWGVGGAECTVVDPFAEPL